MSESVEVSIGTTAAQGIRAQSEKLFRESSGQAVTADSWLGNYGSIWSRFVTA
jgi:hypothetical protein